MLIVSRIKPKRADYREVTVFGVVYRFTKQDDGTYAAEVKDKDAIECLLSGRDFWESGKTQPVLQREHVGTGKKAPSADATLAEEAHALLELSIADMGKEIGNVSSVAVLTAALKEEKEDKQRSGAINLLETAIESAKQAGVKA